MKVICLLVLFFGFSLSQVDINYSYEFKYGSGKQVTIQDTSNYNYLENLLDVSAYLSEYIYIYTQIEYSNPPVFGDSRVNFNKIINNAYLEYTTDRLSIKFGDLNELFGRGLACYTLLDQNVDYSNLLRGASANYYITDDLKISALFGSGDIQFRSNPSFRKSDLGLHTSTLIGSFEYEHDKFGLINYNYIKQNNQIDPSRFSLIGETEIHDDIVERLSDDSDEYLKDAFSSYIRGEYIKDTVFVSNHNLNWNIYIGSFDIYIDKAWIDYQKLYGDDVFGSRFYSSIYTEIFDIGVTYEYKNYNAPYLIKTLANPPIVYREGTSILASRNAHAFNIGNEIGHQVDFNKNMNGINLLGNFSISSKHNDSKIVKYEFNQLLAMNEDSLLALYNPFRQIYFETNGWILSENLYFKLASDYFDEFLDQKYTSAFTLPTQWVLKMDSGNSFTMYLEFQNKSVKQYDQNFKITNEKKSFNEYISISFNQSGKWTLTGFLDRETLKEKTEQWPGMDCSYNISPKTQLSLFYGSQKGGLVCANGICAEQPGFEDGYKITLRSIF